MTTVLSYKGYQGTAEIDLARGVCRGKLLHVADLVTYESATAKEMQSQFEDAVDDYLATCKQLGRAPQKPLSGSFNVRIPAELHRAASVKAIEEGQSLNAVVVQALDSHLHQDRRPKSRRMGVAGSARR